jgi:hypothetical protein
MIRKTLLARLSLAAVLAAALGSSAQAGIIPVSVSVIPEAGNFRWTYSIVLPTDMKLQSGDYFTIYDFAGLQSGSAMVDALSPEGTTAANWAFSSAKTGLTPAGVNPNDDAGIDNLTWTYNGPTIDINGKITLGNFSAASSLGLNTGTEDSFTANNPRSADGIYDSNITTTTVPTGSTDPVGTPEPATLALAGLGLPFIGLARLRRRNKVAA